MSGQPHILEASGLQFAYRPSAPVLRGVDLSARAGSLLCVLGPNGSGKTTLLRCLLGELTPGGGRIELDGRPVEAYSPRRRARLLAYVPQFPVAAFAFTVQEIILTGRLSHTGLLGLAGRKDLDIAREAMKMTHTLEFAGRTLDELSGGEAQCVMIARAIAQQPSVLLLDEPTSHLDVANQLLIYRMMQRLAHDWGVAVVCVSHDVNLASRFTDELLLMRAGRVIASGAPSEVVRSEILSKAYGVEVDLIAAPGQDTPIVRAR